MGFIPAAVTGLGSAVSAIGAVATSAEVTAGVLAGGVGLTAHGQIQQGRQQAAMGKYAQRGADIQARQAYLDEVSNRDIMARQRRARIGAMASQITKSGVSFEGTPLFLLEEANSAMLTEASRVSQASAAKQSSLLQSGGIAAAEGLLARKAGFMSGTGSLIGGLGSAAETYTRLNDNKPLPKMNKG